MKENTIVSLADEKYFDLLEELIESIKSFPESKNISICVLDAGLSQNQIDKIKNKVDEIKKAEWDIEVSSLKVKGKEWLKSQVSRAFLPKYFPNYKKYLWIDCDAWVQEWSSIELYFKACEDGKLGIPDQQKQMIEMLYSQTGLNRAEGMGKPIDIANVALFLASDLSSYMSGQVLTVAGAMIDTY